MVCGVLLSATLVSVAAQVSLLVKVPAAQPLCHAGVPERERERLTDPLTIVPFDMKVPRTYSDFSSGALLPV